MKRKPSLRQQPGRWQEYRVFLGDGFQVLVRYQLNRGDVVAFAVILLREMGESEMLEIRRYDTAHGFAHLDILTRSGNLRNKIHFAGPSDYKITFEHAITDLKANYQEYWQEFIA